MCAVLGTEGLPVKSASKKKLEGRHHIGIWEKCTSAKGIYSTCKVPEAGAGLVYLSNS